MNSNSKIEYKIEEPEIQPEEEVLEKVNGGEYQIWTCDTDEFFACYTLKSSVLEKVKRLNILGMDVRVRTTNIFDDDSVEGVYLANRV